MPPWAIWIPLLAAINLFVFIAIRGRWGRIVLALAMASVIGVATGDWLGSVTGLEIIRIGDMHVIAASVVAQLFMVAVTLLAALGPVRVRG
ncbi:MAG: hypothetical protein LC744_05475 [Chloroflexi bacterium]|nr:hypothetical protein [Chloroflexota bacterium]